MTTLNAPNDQPLQSRGPKPQIQCPICDRVVTRSVDARLAPFIHERVGAPVGYEVFSNFCENCDHVFFFPFMKEEWLDRIYTGYRDDKYTQQRVVHEPSYASVAAELAGVDNPFAAARRYFYDLFLAEYREFDGVVVDYGGGDAVFSTYAFPKAEVVVVEHDFEQRGGDLKSLMQRADMMLCLHVFEHIPRPREALDNLCHYMRPGSKVFIEVPKDYPSTLHEQFHQTESLIAGSNVLPWLTMNTQHEHLNYFSRCSLTSLVSRCGLRPLDYYHSTNNHYSTADMFAVLAQK